MALGSCRFCGAGRIAKDAPVCRACGGWYPNPGICSRLGAKVKLVFCLTVTVGAGALTALFPTNGIAVYAVPIGLGTFVGLISTLIRPYGKPPVA